MKRGFGSGTAHIAMLWVAGIGMAAAAAASPLSLEYAQVAAGIGVIPNEPFSPTEVTAGLSTGATTSNVSQTSAAGSSSAFLAIQPAPLTKVFAKSAGLYYAHAEATLAYDMHVVGPGTGSVPVHVTGSVGTGYSGSASDFGGSTAGLEIMDVQPLLGEQFYNFDACSAGTGPVTATSFSCGVHSASALTIDSIINFGVGDDIVVTIGAEVFALAGWGWGFADPYFQIDPAFLLANPGYSIEIAPGVANATVAQVPETPTLPVLFAALAGWWMRRRSRLRPDRHCGPTLPLAN